MTLRSVDIITRRCEAPRRSPDSPLEQSGFEPLVPLPSGTCAALLRDSRTVQALMPLADKERARAEGFEPSVPRPDTSVLDAANAP